jgi:hypothetical protein
MPIFFCCIAMLLKKPIKVYVPIVVCDSTNLETVALHIPSSLGAIPMGARVVYLRGLADISAVVVTVPQKVQNGT